MKLYIAAPIFKPTQIAMVGKIRSFAEASGHETFSPYHSSQNIFNGRRPADCTQEERDRVLVDNITNIDWADGMVAWVGGMGGFTDPGVVWELGYAYARGKFSVGYLDELEDVSRPSMNLMLSGTLDILVNKRSHLDHAMYLLSKDKQDYARRRYAPAWILGAEMDPVV